MNRNIARTLAVLSFAVLLAAFAPAAHAANCSLETVAGHWGFTLSGTAILPGAGPVLVAAVGEFEADEKGNGSGAEARSIGGGYADETLSGNWTVNPDDCTGTLTVHIYESGQLVRTSIASIVFDRNSKEVRMVQKSLTLPNGTQLPVVITLEGAKQ
jgi:hypothetical protein